MSFTLDLSKFGQKTVLNSEKFIRKIGLDLHSLIVSRTPHKTGRAMANNQISINNLPTDSIDKTDDGTGEATIEAGKRVLSTYKLGDNFFLYNNVEYILPLEYGHSDQAATGMYRMSFEEVAQHLGAK